ncbi:MAG: GTPase Era [Candidatus Omnitrophica bacterium]|nr:GTPase Era [Candidatus Omnitrophota bacterium]MDD5546169.1 GTPase Era [Candidatus Omnitrophota bacterium]
MADKKVFKSGFVAIIGRPNVGKSTVLNRLVGEKVAIVTQKPETTRNKIQGILTRPEAQVVFVDTPGIHKPKNLLGKQITQVAKDVLLEVDLIVFVLDVTKGVTPEDMLIFNLVKAAKKPAILLINKIDLRSKSLALPLIEDGARLYDFREIIPTSASNGDNMDILLEKVIEHLPEGPKYFPDGQFTDRTERFMVGEIIREKALEMTHEEVPHSVAVLIEEFTERPRKLVYIRAVIYVERHSQKKILVGHKGQMLKAIGETARREIQKLLDRHAYLELWVKVHENWRKDPNALKMLGYA